MEGTLCCESVEGTLYCESVEKRSFECTKLAANVVFCDIFVMFFDLLFYLD